MAYGWLFVIGGCILGVQIMGGKTPGGRIVNALVGGMLGTLIWFAGMVVFH